MKNENFKNIKILYVEDDSFIRENAIEYLNRYFDEVYEAKDGLEALAIKEKVQPHIIITDIQMPNLNGIELAKKIRTNDTKTQIIITTAYTNTEYLITAVELQLVKYMVKPILDSKLLKVLEICVASIKEDDLNIKRLSDNTIFDTFNKTLLHDGEIKKLTKNELLFLELLCLNSSRTVSYGQMESHIWYDSYMTDDAIRSLVRAIRRKLPKNSIDNISGIGYKINLIS